MSKRIRHFDIASRVIAFSVAILVLAGCSTVAQAAVGQSQNDYIDSQMVLKTLHDGLQKLQEKEGAIQVKKLCKQLSRKKCTIQLPIATKPTGTASELYKQQKRAVLAVGSLYQCGNKCTKWHTNVASGFLVTSDGVMITNYHVIDKPDAGALGVLTYDGKLYPVAEVLAADKSSDIAVLQLEGTEFPYLNLLPHSPVGSRVSVISHPSKRFYTFTEGMVSAHLLKTSNGTKTPRVSITADFGGGSSGAPVFNERGSVIAMVSTTRAVSATKTCGDSYAQMVFRDCIPAELILKLFAADADASAE